MSLIEKLSRVMDAMGEVGTINQLIAKLRDIEKTQDQDIGGILRKIKKEQTDKIINILDKID